MKNVVMRFWSTRIPDLQYSCPGFGDIVHSCLLTYLYGQAHGEAATLHIASHQYNRDKPTTWNEVIKLFPKDTVFLKPYETNTMTDQAFLDLVLADHPNAELHYYKKYPGKLQKPLTPFFWVDDYLVAEKFPSLAADDLSASICLPESFATMQIDATSIQRRPTQEQVDQLYKKFADLGCEIVVVGGDAVDPALRRATGAGYAMSRAKYHIGVDSGYLHLAQLYFQPENIYLYTNRNENAWEHHLKMARDNGCHINEY